MGCTPRTSQCTTSIRTGAVVPSRGVMDVASRILICSTLKPFPNDSAFAVACEVKVQLQQVPFDASVEDRKEIISGLLTGDYVGRTRVAMEPEPVKNVLRMSPLPASDPKTRRWEWFEDTAADKSALSLDR